MKNVLLFFGIASCLFGQTIVSVTCDPGGGASCHIHEMLYQPTGDYSCACNACCDDGTNPDANYRIWWNLVPPNGGQGKLDGGFGGRVNS
jgi:hypothetical protein